MNTVVINGVTYVELDQDQDQEITLSDASIIHAAYKQAANDSSILVTELRSNIAAKEFYAQSQVSVKFAKKKLSESQKAAQKFGSIYGKYDGSQ